MNRTSRDYYQIVILPPLTPEDQATYWGITTLKSQNDPYPYIWVGGSEEEAEGWIMGYTGWINRNSY